MELIVAKLKSGAYVSQSSRIRCSMRIVPSKNPLSYLANTRSIHDEIIHVSNKVVGDKSRSSNNGQNGIAMQRILVLQIVYTLLLSRLHIF